METNDLIAVGQELLDLRAENAHLRELVQVLERSRDLHVERAEILREAFNTAVGLIRGDPAPPIVGSGVEPAITENPQ
jgi:hypothetical protein